MKNESGLRTKNQTLKASFFMPEIYGLWGVLVIQSPSN